MRQRSIASNQPAKARRRKAAKPKRGKAPKAVRNPGASVAGQETVVARLTRERDEALEQLSAATHILAVINSSPGDLKPVFEAILSNATRICDAKFGSLWLAKDDGFQVAATHGLPPAYRKQVQPGVVLHPGPRTGLSRWRGTRA